MTLSYFFTLVLFIICIVMLVIEPSIYDLISSDTILTSNGRYINTYPITKESKLLHAYSKDKIVHVGNWKFDFEKDIEYWVPLVKLNTYHG